MLDTLSRRIVPNKLKNVNVVLIPGWVHRALVRNKLNIIDVNDYSKVRPVLSLDDLSEWVSLNNHFKLEGCRLGTEVLTWNNATEEQKIELNSTIYSQSYSLEVENAINQKLSDSNRMNNSRDVSQVNHGEVPSNYKFVPIQGTLYIILNEGFMLDMQNKDNSLDFVKRYLKECYAMASVSDVSSLSIFSLYIKKLFNNYMK